MKKHKNSSGKLEYIYNTFERNRYASSLRCSYAHDEHHNTSIISPTFDDYTDAAYIIENNSYIRDPDDGFVYKIQDNYINNNNIANGYNV
jgi:hypothetical protein